MGNIKSQPDSTITDAISKFSHFDPKDITQWFLHFRKTHPFITREILTNAFESLFPFGNCVPFTTILFNTINISQSDKIDFNEFLIAFSILTRGSKYEKLNWVFRLFDGDGDGYISKTEMSRVVESVYEMVGNFYDMDTDANYIVAQVYKDVENESGFLSFEDFKILVGKRNAIGFFIWE